MFATFVSLAIAIYSVQAHGYVESVTIEGTEYTGWLINSDPYTTPTPERVVRVVPGNGPVQDLTSIDLQCNGYESSGSEPAALVATAAAGDTVDILWTAWPETHKGPTVTYMAKAPEDITTWQPGTDAVWFKVAEEGKNADGEWAATDILTANNNVYSFTIPENLEPGQYLIRHELIALHAAYTYPGIQFYPVCIQVEVTGSGTGSPSDLVAFPGAYTPDTPGIAYDIVSETGDYPIPGPPVWTGN